MSTKDTGLPAFPATVVDGGSDGIGKRDGVWHYPGMTLRDYFAAKVLEAILSQLDKGIRPQDCIRAAEDAYFMADAMLEARKQ
jgi:hypothetical protein